MNSAHETTAQASAAGVQRARRQPEEPSQQQDPLRELQQSAGNQAMLRLLGGTSGATVQRKAKDGQPATSDAAAPEPAKAAPPLIVEDDAKDVKPGQMRKSDFLSQLRTAVCSTAEEALSGTMWSAMGCPYIERWLDHYSKQPSAYVERALRKYAPETASARTAQDFFPLVTQRVRRGIAEWSSTGEVKDLPEEFAEGEMPGATVGGMVGGLLSEVGSAISGAVSSVGSMLFKHREGNGAEPAADPEAIQAQLSSGQPLESGVQRKMKSAFGQDFSHVRVHADSGAAQLSESLNARAFTVGGDVAFGSGEYKPGTPVGDALIAHELAHVVQQGSSASAPQKKGGGSSSALEDDADRAAVGAVLSQWGGKLGDAGRAAMPQLKSGLRLSRCGKSDTSTAEKKTVTVNPTYLSGGSTSFSAHVTKANTVFKPANVEVKAGTAKTLNETESKAILGEELELKEYKDVSSPTTEEQKLLKVNQAPGTITLYYVKSMSDASRGEAFPPYSGQAPGVVYASDNSRTFPHELGHMLLNSADHPKDADNFMHETDGASGKDIMTAEQIESVRDSSFAK